MAKKGGGQQETEADKAVARVAKAKVEYFRTRLQPQQNRLAQNIDAMGAENSSERRQARGAATTDTDVAFADAGAKQLKAASASGNFGGAGQKLGISSLADDQATSVGLNQNQADLNVDAARISGLNSVVQMGQGKEATAIAGLTSQAQMARAQANADADAALQRDAGYASLAGQAAGAGIGYLSNRPPSLNATYPTVGGGAEGGYVIPSVGG